MDMHLRRRGLLSGAGTLLAASALPFDLAQAQAAGGTLRIGMTAAAVPLTNGVPDQGAEGHRFMGVTLYDQLIHWDLSKADAPARLGRSGLAGVGISGRACPGPRAWRRGSRRRRPPPPCRGRRSSRGSPHRRR